MQHPGPVLVIEDDEAIRSFLRSALEDDGYWVVTASSGIEGVAETRQSAPSLVLLDLRMPNGNGLEFLEAYHAEDLGDVPIVIMTAAGVAELPTSRFPIAAVINKPFDLDLLIETVRRLYPREPSSRQCA